MTLQYKNSSIYYEDEGDGDAVVLLHGFLENSEMWKHLKPGLLKNSRVVSIDLLGHGQSECIGYIHTMNDMADAVLAVLKHLEIKTYELIGHSMGGYVALAIAEKNPKAVIGLCLMNSTYKADDKERKEIRKRAIKMIKSNFNSLIQMSFTNLFSPENRITYKNELNEALKLALKTPVQGYIAAQEGMMLREDKFEFYNGLNAKKLIVIGQKDPVVDAKSLIRETQNTSIKCVEMVGGHMSYIENKSELSDIIMRFNE